MTAISTLDRVFVTDREFEEYIYDLKSRGSVMGLQRIKALLKALSDPEDDLMVIHIAGTNGKGSVLAMCESILMQAGYKVGTFSSPALSKDTESIRVNGRSIPAKTYKEYFERFPAMEEAAGCTFFELLTTVSLLYFKEKKVDVVILECGLGGRDDSTNVVKKPLISVITSISADHSDILGKTLSDIAEIKCGIIKNDSIVISAPQVDEVREVIQKKAAQKNSDLIFSEEAESVKSGAKLEISYKGGAGKRRKFSLALKGSYQLVNAGVAIEVSDALRDRYGFDISKEAVKKGLSETKWPGRFECISKKPLIYVDGAHNVAGAKALRKTIERDLQDKRLIFVMGVFKDKDYEGIAAKMCDLAESVITIKAPGERGLDAYELAKVVLKYNKNVTSAGSVEEACELAHLLAREDGVIVAFGSLSYLSHFTKCVAAAKQKYK